MSKSNIQLIGIHGHAGAGKTTIARYLCEFYKDTYAEAFADPLKKACSAATGIPLEVFNDSQLKEEPYDYWGISPRRIAQFVGTEMFRDLGPKMLGLTGLPKYSFWVQRFDAHIFHGVANTDEGIYVPGDTVVIPDVRFNDEVQFILDNQGILIDVKRSGYEGNVGIANHRSEAGIEVSDFTRHYLIQNNGTLPQLFEQVETILELATKQHQFFFEKE